MHVHPHRLADSAEHDAGHDEKKAEGEPSDGKAFDPQEIDEVRGEDAALRGDRCEAGADERQPDHETEQGKAEGALGDIGGAGSPRIARAERGIGQRGEQSGDERDDEGKPHGIADLSRRLADQAVDAGAEHAAEPIEGHLRRPDRALQRRFVGGLRRSIRFLFVSHLSPLSGLNYASITAERFMPCKSHALRLSFDDRHLAGQYGRRAMAHVQTLPNIDNHASARAKRPG